MKKTPKINLICVESESSESSNSIDESDMDKSPSEYEKIRINNRKIKKELFGSLMEFRRSSRQLISESFASQNPCEGFIDINQVQPDNQVASKKENLKYLNQVFQLYNQLQTATCELVTAREKITSTDEEAQELHIKLQNIEAEINNKLVQKEPNCQCRIL